MGNTITHDDDDDDDDDDDNEKEEIGYKGIGDHDSVTHSVVTCGTDRTALAGDNTWAAEFAHGATLIRATRSAAKRSILTSVEG